MSPATHLSVLALASTALAARHGHMAHKYLHSSHEGVAYGTGTSAPFAYPTANATGGWGSTGLPSSIPSYGASSSAAGYGTATEHVTHIETVYQTIHAAYASASSSVAAAGYGSSDSGSDSCGVVTVTSTEQVTQYVTEGSAPSSSSTEASPVESSSASAPAYSAPAYSSSSSSSSEASPVSTSSGPAAPAYSAPASSSTVVAPTSAAPSYSSSPVSTSSSAALAGYSVANKGADNYAAASSTSSAATSYTSASSAGGKRGLAYNDASLVSCFSGAREVSWAYNWGSSSDGLDDGFTFIPTLWGTSSDFTGSWSENAKSAISSGSTHLFSFNEPDLAAQANLGYAAAATAYATYMNPFKGQAQLCAPAVTNGGGSMGLTWLQSFLDSCTDCQIDCLNIHWYDSAENTAYFKSHVQQAIDMANGKPVFVSEFGATGSDDQIASFLEEVMPWMDSNSGIAGYAYYMVADGLLVSGSEPSTYGSTYKTYTS